MTMNYIFLHLLPMMLLVTGIMVALWSIYRLGNPSKAAKRRLTQLRSRHGNGNPSAQAAATAQIRKLMAATGGQGKGSLAGHIANFRVRLEQTGRDITVKKYLMACGGVFAATFFFLTLKGAPSALCLGLALLAALALPYFVTGRMVKKRAARFVQFFPDAIELMVRGLRSGLPITETMAIVGTEIPDPVGKEFRAVGDSMKIGRTMEQSLDETSERIGTPEFAFFCITLAIQRETGGNLAETLSNLADVLRKRSQMKLKIKAMSSESKASAMIVGALPFVVFTLVWMANPKYLGGFFSDPRLMIAGSVGLCWMSIGGWIMAKMVNFEI